MLKSTFSGLVTMLSLTIRVYVHSFSSYCLPNLRNPTKFSAISYLQHFKVIDLGANRKHIYNFLLVSIVSVLLYLYLSVSVFCLTPSSRGTPCPINVVYTSLESTFSGLQLCRRRYRSIFIRLAVVASQNHVKLPTKVDITAVQGHQRSSILMSIKSSYATSY